MKNSLFFQTIKKKRWKFASIMHCNDIRYEFTFNRVTLCINNKIPTNVKSCSASIKIQIIQNRGILFKPTTMDKSPVKNT